MLIFFVERMSELQIRGGIEDKSKIISLIFSTKTYIVSLIRMSRQDISNKGSHHMLSMRNKKNYL